MNLPDANTVLWSLTASQMEVWDTQMRSPHSPFFNHAEYVDSTGPISPVLFEQALLRMEAEAECLMIRLVETAEEPLQAIGPDLRWKLPVIDMSSSTKPQSAAELWMCQDVDCVFDLTHEPLFRCGLLRSALDRDFWFHCYHHLCIDNFEMPFVAHRVAALYSALVESELCRDLGLKSADPSFYGTVVNLISFDEIPTLGGGEGHVRSGLDVEVPVRTLFDTSTVANALMLILLLRWRHQACRRTWKSSPHWLGHSACVPRILATNP